MLVVPRTSVEDLSNRSLSKMLSTTPVAILLLFSLLVPISYGFDHRLVYCTLMDSFLAALSPLGLQPVYESLSHHACRWRDHDQTVDRGRKDLFYHLGGNSPWIPKRRDTVGSALVPPEGCEVEQVHMLSRHAERYPTISAGTRHLALWNRLKSLSELPSPAFDFLHNWTYFTPPDDPAFESLTSTSQHAGTMGAFNTGVKLRTRYERLLPHEGTTTRFWSASSSRDVATAQYFADGLFGRGWEVQKTAELHVVSESPDRGADTLTPGDTCLRYLSDKTGGRNKGYTALAEWQDHFTAPIKRRLEQGKSSFGFTSLEIFSMMEMCGFEMLVRDGISPWCDLFTDDEWLDFEYARDLIHFYRAGPGNQYSRAMGWLWLNATLDLLIEGPETGKLFFSFVHDGDMIPMLSALGYPSGYDDDPDVQMPRDRNIRDRAYKTSDITPMGGRLIVERLHCEGSSGSESYIRVNINDGVIPISTHALGPGNSTSLADFIEYLMPRRELAGDFREICGLDQDAADRITFLHQ